MNKLSSLRKNIDKIDGEIIELLIARFVLVKKIGIYKKINNLKIRDQERQLQVGDNIRKRISSRHRNFILKLYKLIINYSRKLQKKA